MKQYMVVLNKTIDGESITKTVQTDNENEVYFIIIGLFSYHFKNKKINYSIFPTIPSLLSRLQSELHLNNSISVYRLQNTTK